MKKRIPIHVKLGVTWLYIHKFDKVITFKHQSISLFWHLENFLQKDKTGVPLQERVVYVFFFFWGGGGGEFCWDGGQYPITCQDNFYLSTFPAKLNDKIFQNKGKTLFGGKTPFCPKGIFPEHLNVKDT